MQCGESMGRDQQGNEEDQFKKMIVITQVKYVGVWSQVVAVEESRVNSLKRDSGYSITALGVWFNAKMRGIKEQSRMMSRFLA